MLAENGKPMRRGDLLMAFAPYLIIIVVLGITSLSAIKVQLDKATSIFSWPGLQVIKREGEGAHKRDLRRRRGGDGRTRA